MVSLFQNNLCCPEVILLHVGSCKKEHCLFEKLILNLQNVNLHLQFVNYKLLIQTLQTLNSLLFKLLLIDTINVVMQCSILRLQYFAHWNF